jgi:hypothetical protein
VEKTLFKVVLTITLLKLSKSRHARKNGSHSFQGSWLVQISYFARTARHTGKHGARTGYTLAYLVSISFIWSKTTVGYLYSLAQSKVRKSLSRASSGIYYELLILNKGRLFVG